MSADFVSEKSIHSTEILRLKNAGWKVALQVAIDGRVAIMIQIKRTYEPATPDDGRRILIERLWPRGIKKEALAADAWLKDVAPSSSLRKWFGHRVDRWDEFRRRYRKELNAHRESWSAILAASKKGTVTLLYSAHDREHNGAVVLHQYLMERGRPHGLKLKGGARRPSSHH